MSFSTGTNYCDKCGKPLGIFKEGLCLECEKAEQEPCDDVVNRQAVINLIRRCNTALEEPRIFDNYSAGVKFEQYVTELPPVRPQEKTGHWIKIEPYPLQMHDYECSECGHETDDNTEDYCSGCGARMVELQESEDKE